MLNFIFTKPIDTTIIHCLEQNRSYLLLEQIANNNLLPYINHKDHFLFIINL